LGYHGCDQAVGERLLAGEAFRPSENAYDWLGPGIYFWEANPRRGLAFALEAARRKRTGVTTPFVIGAVIELGLCLDMTTSSGIELVRQAYDSLVQTTTAAGVSLPANTSDRLRRNLDCAVVRRLHSILASADEGPIDTVKGIFTEGGPVYPSAGFELKTHIQIAVCRETSIKGVFRVPAVQLEPV
jgi:hypothetical protein